MRLCGEVCADKSEYSCAARRRTLGSVRRAVLPPVLGSHGFLQGRRETVDTDFAPGAQPKHHANLRH